MRRTTLLVAALLTMFVRLGDAAAQETPRAGGVLKVATIGEPPTLDIQATTTPRDCVSGTRGSRGDRGP